MRTRGFTLVELVISLVILAILAVAVSSYLGLGARMYADVAEREQVLGQSRFVIERMVRELRNAAPGSVREDTVGLLHCIEFVPINSAGSYIYAPIGETKNYLWAIDTLQNIENKRLVIYPGNASAIYDATSDNNVQIVGTGGASVPEGAIQINFNAHPFAQGSPEQRYYVLDNPVSYCLLDNTIMRYDNYGFNTIQQLNLPNGVLMAEGVIAADFHVQDAVLTRNSVVNILLQFGADSGSDMFFNYEVHLPNVP